MSRLLAALDAAVACNLPAVQDAVLDKSHKAYMAQLLEVQHSRGAVGGEAFAEVLGGAVPEDISQRSAYRRRRSPALLQPVKVYALDPNDIPVGEVRSFIVKCFTDDTLHQSHWPSICDTMRALQRHMSLEVMKNASNSNHRADGAFDIASQRAYCTEVFEAFNHLLQHRSSCSVFVKGLHTHYDLSAPLFRILLQLHHQDDPHHLRPCLHIVSSILQLNHSGQYNASALTAVLKQFPKLSDLKVPQYDSKSSPFSIANLAGASTTTSSKPAIQPQPAVVVSAAAAKNKSECDLYAPCSMRNEVDILNSLRNSPPHAIERQIRRLVEIAIKTGKLGLVRTALTQLLTEVSDIVKSETKLSRRSIALLLDWLQVIDPELQESPLQLRKMLLFARYPNQPAGIGVGGYSQAHLLGSFTQQANWKTLEQTVQNLLCTYDSTLNPGGVLDFVWAVMKVPKLWQGREKRTPRHSKQPLLLQLNNNHLLTLAQYVLAEKVQYKTDSGTSTSGLPDRMPLILQWYGDNGGLYRNLVQRLCLSYAASVDKSERDANMELMYQLYLQRPCILSHVSSTCSKMLPSIASSESKDIQSSADVPIHCLLTMICNPESGREFRKRLHELEAALRALVSKHPLLLLRHFHLIYSGLDGLSHLHLMVLKGNNNLEVLLIIAGILELLHPHLFDPNHNAALRKTFDCYMNIFDKHGAPVDLAPISSRIVGLLHAWLVADRHRALNYLVTKHDLLESLSQQAKEWRHLAVAASSAPSFSTEPPVDDPVTNAPPLPKPSGGWLNDEIEAVALKLNRAKPGDEQLDAYHQLDYLAGRAPTSIIAGRFINTISSGIHNIDCEIRSISWNLMSRVLVEDPNLASQFVSTVVNAIQSDNSCVVKTALDHLPDVMLMLHASAPLVLTAAFSAVTTKVPHSLPSLTKALTLLTIHTGA